MSVLKLPLKKLDGFRGSSLLQSVLKHSFIYRSLTSLRVSEFPPPWTLQYANIRALPKATSRAIAFQFRKHHQSPLPPNTRQTMMERKTIFTRVRPKNDPILQLAERRKAEQRKWEESKQAEGSDSQKESLSRDGSVPISRPFEEPQESSDKKGRKRKAADDESEDEVEFVSQAKKPKPKTEEGPRSIFGNSPVLPVGRT